MTVSSIASSGLHALNLAGRHGEAAAFGAEVMPDLEALGDTANLPDVYAHTIEALIGAHLLDDASALVGKAEAYPSQSVHLARVKGELGKLMQHATDIAAAADADRTVMTAEEFAANDNAMRVLRHALARSGDEMNEWKAGEILRQVGNLFLDHRGRDRERLEWAHATLLPVEGWARSRGHTAVHNDALWQMSASRYRRARMCSMHRWCGAFAVPIPGWRSTWLAR